ncbi:MAG: hypothetical protein RL722_1441 [Pseudomonadota bacterium]
MTVKDPQPATQAPAQPETETGNSTRAASARSGAKKAAGTMPQLADAAKPTKPTKAAKAPKGGAPKPVPQVGAAPKESKAGRSVKAEVDTTQAGKGQKVAKADKVAKPAKVGKAEKVAKLAKVTKAGKTGQVKPDAMPVAAPFKIKMVRDGFTMPELEYAQLGALKRRSLALGHGVKKGEILRAGLSVLANLDDAALLSALRAVPSLKAGRPKSGEA